MLPKEIELLRNSDHEYPEDEKNIYSSLLDLDEQLDRATSKSVKLSFSIFKQYVSFLNQICEIAESSKSFYDANGKQLQLIDQICYNFMNEVLCGHFKPILMSKKYVEIRTAFQIFLLILKESKSHKFVQTMFNFIFGKTLSQIQSVTKSEDDFASSMY